MKDLSSAAQFKKDAGVAAASLVVSGQKVGLGTGSTAAFAIEELGRRVREESLRIDCAATSLGSLMLARKHGLVVHPLEVFEELDISIDGADEIDPHLNLIKGGGAAHTIEKLVHSMSKYFIVVADSSKLVDVLGGKFWVPVEVLYPALSFASKKLRDLGASEVKFRTGNGKDGPTISDSGNVILDAKFQIHSPEDLEEKINAITGVVENGLFTPRSVSVKKALIAGESGLKEMGK